jgi:hypothetical protein
MPTPRGQQNNRCSICSHEQRYRIELAMVSGVGRRVIAKRFGVSGDAAWRHFQNHVSEERRATLIAGPVKLHEMAERATEMGLSLLDYSNIALNLLVSQFTAAAEAGDRQGTALVGGKLLECLRLQAQLNGELTRATSNVTNNTLVLSSPLMADLRSMLIERLRPYPEAGRAVLEGLQALAARAVNGAAAPALLEARA